MTNENRINEVALTCVVCPRGCRITATVEGGKVTEVSGNECARGKRYAADEVTDPRRTLTSTVFTEGASSPLVAVRTSAAIPKAKMSEAMEIIRSLTVKAPIRRGDVIVKDFIDGGIDLIATADLLK